MPFTEYLLGISIMCNLSHLMQTQAIMIVDFREKGGDEGMEGIVAAIWKMKKAEDKISFFLLRISPCLFGSIYSSLPFLAYYHNALDTGQHTPVTLVSIICHLLISYLTGFLVSLLLPFKDFLTQFSNLGVHHKYPKFIKQVLTGFQLRISDSVGLWWALRFSFL